MKIFIETSSHSPVSSTYIHFDFQITLLTIERIQLIHFFAFNICKHGNM